MNITAKILLVAYTIAFTLFLANAVVFGNITLAAYLSVIMIVIFIIAIIVLKGDESKEIKRCEK